MNRKMLQVLIAGLLTCVPFAMAQAASPELAPQTTDGPAELSLPGLFVDCAGLDAADARQGVPDCIIQAITRDLQRRIEIDAALYLQVKLQDQHRRLLAGDPPASDARLTAVPDRADSAS